MRGHRTAIWLIVLLPLLGIALATGALTYYFKQSTQRYISEQTQRIEQEYKAVKERQSREWVQRTTELFAHREGELREDIKNRLKVRIDAAHNTAEQIYAKYADKKTARRHIIQALSQISWEGERNTIRITDYEGGNILPGSIATDEKNIAGYCDARGRATVLEEIQKVRRYGEGSIESCVNSDGASRITYVKDFGRYGWYLATSMEIEKVRNELKERLREAMRSMSWDGSGLGAVLDGNGTVYMSHEAKKYLDEEATGRLRSALKPHDMWHSADMKGAYVYSSYFEPFGWYVVHGFDTAPVDEDTARFRFAAQMKMKQETETLYAVSALSALLALGLFALLGRKISGMFAVCGKRASSCEGEDVTRDVQALHGVPVAAEALADMIIHQWRHPRERMLSLLNEIETAYAEGGLTPQLLEKNVQQGRDELSSVSHSLDLLGNVFSTAGGREEMPIAEAVDTSADMMAKSLEVHGIGLQVTHYCYCHLAFERGMLIQLLLALMLILKNGLLRHENAHPVIKVSTRESDGQLLIELCANTICDETFRKDCRAMEHASAELFARMGLEAHLAFEEKAPGGRFTVKVAKSGLL